MATEERVDARAVIAHAHARIMADPAIQFHFTPLPPQSRPSWLIALFNALVKLAPHLKTPLWIVLGLVVVAITAIAARTAWRYVRTPKAASHKSHRLADPPSLQPAAPRVRALLEEADRLAAEDRFEEAAHVLLFRTIDDLQVRRPRTVRPSLTSRDIAGLEALPPRARSAFALIADRVERSVFGGRRLDSADFAACRQAYQAFASADSWVQGAAF